MNADVIIIGGGIAGCSAAFHLAESGVSTLLLDRGEISGEASGVNMGGLGASGWGNSPGLQEYLTMGSLNIFKKLQLELGYDIEFRQSGSFTAIHTENQYSYAQSMVIESQKNAFNLQLLSPYEAKSLEPELNLDLFGYIYSPTRGQADPYKTTQAFSKAALHAGLKVQTTTEVIGITSSDSVWHVETNKGNYAAQSVVIAAGAWSKNIGEMVGVNIPIKPVVGQMWSTEPLPPRVFGTIASIESSFHWTEKPYVDDKSPPELTHFGDERVTRHLYGRQRRSGEIIFGGDRRSLGFSKSIDAAGIEVNKTHASEVLPLLSGLPVSSTWSGLMPFSDDGKPVIGRIPKHDNLFVVSGLGSSGFGRGPAAGMLIADLICRGESHPVLLESDPARFAS